MSVEKPKILIIDDDVMVQSLILAHLDALELTADTCQNAEEALIVITQESPSLIFLDISLTFMNGIQCCREIRELEHMHERPRSVIIAITGSTHEDECLQYDSAGFDKIVGKPFNHKDIKSCLELLTKPTENSKVVHFDKALALESLDGNDALLPTMITMFVDLMPEIEDEIIVGMKESNLEQVGIAAHTLKSRSLLVGAAILNKLALEMEMKAKDGIEEALPELLDSIKNEFFCVKKEFEIHGFTP